MATATELLEEYEQFRAKCVKFIESEAEKAGGVTNLSRKLGYDLSYISQLLKRRNSAGLIKVLLRLKTVQK